MEYSILLFRKSNLKTKDPTFQLFTRFRSGMIMWLLSILNSINVLKQFSFSDLNITNAFINTSAPMSWKFNQLCPIYYTEGMYKLGEHIAFYSTFLTIRDVHRRQAHWYVFIRYVAKRCLNLLFKQQSNILYWNDLNITNLYLFIY